MENRHGRACPGHEIVWWLNSSRPALRPGMTITVLAPLVVFVARGVGWTVRRSFRIEPAGSLAEEVLSSPQARANPSPTSLAPWRSGSERSHTWRAASVERCRTSLNVLSASRACCQAARRTSSSSSSRACAKLPRAILHLLETGFETATPNEFQARRCELAGRRAAGPDDRDRARTPTIPYPLRFRFSLLGGRIPKGARFPSLASLSWNRGQTRIWGADLAINRFGFAALGDQGVP